MTEIAALDDLIATHVGCLACEADIPHNGPLLPRDVVRRLRIDGNLLAHRLGVGYPDYMLDPAPLPYGVALEHADDEEIVAVAGLYERDPRRLRARGAISAGQLVARHGNTVRGTAR